MFIFSECGRRGRENGTGTDHGAAGVAFAIGKRVNVVFQDMENGLTLPQFTLSDEEPGGAIWRNPNT